MKYCRKRYIYYIYHCFQKSNLVKWNVQKTTTESKSPCMQVIEIGRDRAWTFHFTWFRLQGSMQVSKIPKLVLQSTYGRRKCNFQTWVIAFSSLVKVLQDHSGIYIIRYSTIRFTRAPIKESKDPVLFHPIPLLEIFSFF